MARIYKGDKLLALLRIGSGVENVTNVIIANYDSSVDEYYWEDYNFTDTASITSGEIEETKFEWGIRFKYENGVYYFKYGANYVRFELSNTEDEDLLKEDYFTDWIDFNWVTKYSDIQLYGYLGNGYLCFYLEDSTGETIDDSLSSSNIASLNEAGATARTSTLTKQDLVALMRLWCRKKGYTSPV